MAWYSLSWSHRGSVELNSAYIDEAVPVVPIFLSGLDATWWANIDTAGDDIIITEDDGVTERDYYLVAIDATGKTGLLMVNVDGYSSTSVNKKLFVYCGNSGASAASTTATFTSTGYVGVWFPGESTADASGGGRTLTAVNSPGTAAAAAYEIDAATYDSASTQYHKYDGAQGATNWPLSIEAIVLANNVTADHVFVSLGDNASTDFSNIASVMLAGTDGDRAASLIAGTNSGYRYNLVSSPTFVASTWYSLAATISSGGTSIDTYIDNGTVNQSTTVPSPSFNALTIGAWRRSSPIYLANGSVAFAAISDEVRSADYIATMYDAWSTAAFRTYGPTDTAPTTNDTGWIPFTSVSAAGWTNPTYAIGDLVDGASYNPDEEETTPTLVARNVSTLADDVSGTVTDLWYRVVAESDTGGSEQIDTTLARMVIGGSQSGNNFSASFEFGPKVDKVWKHSDASFGTLPNPGEIQDGDNFGIALEFTNVGTDPTSVITVYTIECRVFYTPSGGSPETSGWFSVL